MAKVNVGHDFGLTLKLKQGRIVHQGTILLTFSDCKNTKQTRRMIPAGVVYCL
jgi:hypothetical protein